MSKKKCPHQGKCLHGCENCRNQKCKEHRLVPKIKKKCAKKEKVVGLGGQGGEGGSGKGDLEKGVKGIGAPDESSGLEEALGTKKCHCTGKCRADTKCEICGSVSKCAGALCQGPGLGDDKSIGLREEGFEGFIDPYGDGGQGEGELSTKSSYYYCQCKEDNKCKICGRVPKCGRELCQDLRSGEEADNENLGEVGFEGEDGMGAEAGNGLLYCLDWQKLRALLVFTAGSFLTMRMALFAVELGDP